MKSWFSKTSKYIKAKTGSLRSFITNRYSSALKIANGIKEGFFILTGFVGGGKIAKNHIFLHTSCKGVYICDQNS